MMTGTGQFGPLEMGGMFTVFKVRKDQKPGDYKDPGPYNFPEGTVAQEYKGLLSEPARLRSEISSGKAANDKPSSATVMNAKKPSAHSGH
jgi:manganese oxidase